MKINKLVQAKIGISPMLLFSGLVVNLTKCFIIIIIMESILQNNYVYKECSYERTQKCGHWNAKQKAVSLAGE